MPDATSIVTNPRARALASLEITEDALARCPQITPQLRMIAQTIRRAGQPQRRRVPQVLADIISDQEDHPQPYGPGADLVQSWPQYLHMIEDPAAASVLDAYYSVTVASLRRKLPVEAFCLAAKVSPLRILELLTAACVRSGAQASQIIAAVNHPRVVEKTVEMALTDEGTEDRMALHRATGFIAPAAKGPAVNVNVNANASSSAQAAAIVRPAPPPESTIRRMVDRFNDAASATRTQAALPATSATEIPHAESAEASSARELVRVESNSESDPDSDPESDE